MKQFWSCCFNTFAHYKRISRILSLLSDAPTSLDVTTAQRVLKGNNTVVNQAMFNKKYLSRASFRIVCFSKITAASALILLASTSMAPLLDPEQLQVVIPNIMFDKPKCPIWPTAEHSNFKVIGDNVIEWLFRESWNILLVMPCLWYMDMTANMTFHDLKDVSKIWHLLCAFHFKKKKHYDQLLLKIQFLYFGRLSYDVNKFVYDRLSRVT